MLTAAQRFRAALARKVATLEPAMARAFLAGIRALQDRLSTAELNALIRAGAVDRYIALALSDDNLSAAFTRYRAQAQVTMRTGASYFTSNIPGRIAVAFDVLSPQVIEAVRALDSVVMARLGTETREAVRAIIENGLRDGASPASTSRAIRSMIGLGPTQVQEVANFRAALEAGQAGKALGYAARDRRFDASIRNGTLTPGKIETMVEAYTKRRIAINAATTAQTATLESFKAGQRLSWDAAIEAGTVDGSRLRRRWMTVMDGRARPEHEEMNGVETGFDEAYPNGDMIVGEGSPWNCRCSDYVFLGR